MENPWRSLRMEAPYVYEADRPAVDAFNTQAGEDHCIHTDLLPEPFLGSKDAPIVLLNLNPGFDERDYLTYEHPDALDAWRKNAVHEPLAYPFYLLDPQFSHAGGARWWREKLKEPIQIAGAHAVANMILCIEYFPYHSRKFKPMHRLVETQQYSFALVNQAIDRNAVIVLMRGKRLWEGAVPRLSESPRLFTLKAPLNPAISRKNCVDGFPSIEGILRNGAPHYSELPAGSANIAMTSSRISISGTSRPRANCAAVHE
jgi:hypothetical protein